MNFLFRLPCPCQEVCLTVFWAFRTTEPGSPEKWVSKSPLSRALGRQGSVPKEGEHTAAAFERKEASAEGLQFLRPVLCQSKGSGEPGSSTRERKPWHLNRWSSRWALLVYKRAVEVVEARDDKCCVVIQPHSAHGAWIRRTKQQKKFILPESFMSLPFSLLCTPGGEARGARRHFSAVSALFRGLVGFFFNCHYLLFISWACVTPACGSGERKASILLFWRQVEKPPHSVLYRPVCLLSPHTNWLDWMVLSSHKCVSVREFLYI